MTVVVVDYGMGNVASIRNMLGKLGHEAILTSDPESVFDADRVILPGVGAFDEAVEALQSSGLDRAILDRTEQRNAPLMGVCLGMQLLCDSSQEGQRPGLGLIPGVVRRFPGRHEGKVLRVPHMAWGEVVPRGSGTDLPSLGDNARYYFVHSYFVDPDDPDDVIGTTEYGVTFASAIQRGRVIGVQFHPEKSHRHGMRLLNDFVNMKVDQNQ